MRNNENENSIYSIYIYIFYFLRMMYCHTHNFCILLNFVIVFLDRIEDFSMFKRIELLL